MRSNAQELFALYEKGAIKPRISKRFPLAEAGAAIAWLAGRQALGKVDRDGALMTPGDARDGHRRYPAMPPQPRPTRA